VLVANPTRLASLVRAGRLRLDDVRMVVVDEGDTLAAPGQSGDLLAVLDATPATRQLLFVSATLPETMRQWVLQRPERPALLVARDAHAPPEGLRVRNVRVRDRDRADAANDALVALAGRGIVFANRREGAEAAAAALAERGQDVILVHGGLQPNDRRKALDRFRRGEGRVLVTTELAGRGLHFPDLAFVVNWNLPPKPSDYLHRVGRLGRAGGTPDGEVVNLVGAEDGPRLPEIERLTRGGKLDTGEPARPARKRR